MSETPLIWTIKGNIPIENLNYSVTWDDMEDRVTFTETYKLADEVVKQSVHVMIKKGLAIFGEQGNLG